MSRWVLSGALTLIAAGAVAAQKPTQFWNLTSKTVVSLRLSHAGSGEYGDNVAIGDEDGVDHDERAKIVGLPTGLYDLELKFKGGRVCFVHDTKIFAGQVFSVEDKQLVACTKS
jgi:hypothetical protein